MSSEDGSVFSPNYPQNYNKNETCEWLIEVSDGDSIDLTFEDVDLYTSENCSRNYVKVGTHTQLPSSVVTMNLKNSWGRFEAI